jgi:hypothetical protein
LFVSSFYCKHAATKELFYNLGLDADPRFASFQGHLERSTMRHVNNNDTDNNLAAVGNFGADIVPDVIVGAQGSEYITSNGRRVLDWTSGQVSVEQPNRIDLQ